MNAPLFFHAVAIPDAQKAKELLRSPALRKATSGIAQGVVAIEQLFVLLPQLQKRIESGFVGIVVGSSVGEIEVTRDFLKEFATKSVARPFLFQLSAHNSTLGFLTGFFKCVGPCLTISNQYQTSEGSLEAAMLLIDSGACEAVVVFCFDTDMDQWIDTKTYGENTSIMRSSGAVAMVCSRDEHLFEQQPVGRLTHLSFGENTQKDPTAGLFFDSDTLYRIATRLNEEQFGPAEIVKPDSSMTQFTLEKLF